jgi:hypothetical protein
MYKWIRGIVVIEQRVDKYKYKKKKREIWILREKTVRERRREKRKNKERRRELAKISLKGKIWALKCINMFSFSFKFLFCWILGFWRFFFGLIDALIWMLWVDCYG